MSTTEKPSTTREAAEAWGVSYMTVWRHVRSGDIPHTKLGAKILIPAWVVQAVLDGQPIAKPAGSPEKRS